MANLKKPLPIFHKSKIYEIDLDYDKPLVEPTAGDQVSAGSKPGDKKDDNVKDKKKDESDDDDEESDSDGKKKKEEEQRSPLKLIIDLNEDIHSMSSSGDYIVLLTTNNYNTKQLTILKRTSPASKPSVIAKLQAAKDSSVVHFDGRLLALFDDDAALGPSLASTCSPCCWPASRDHGCQMTTSLELQLTNTDICRTILYMFEEYLIMRYCTSSTLEK
jgi:hypothetical protein